VLQHPIALVQCVNGVWAETHHWKFAFASEVEGGGGWTKPHLPTISVRALLSLYEELTEANVRTGSLRNRAPPSALPFSSIATHAPSTLRMSLCTHVPRPQPPPPAQVNLNVAAAAFPDAARAIVAGFVASGRLPPALEQAAYEIIASRTAASLTDASGTIVGRSAPVGPIHPDLSPEADEEAFDLLVAHSDLVDTLCVAFMRLLTPIQMGCRKLAPCRFLFVLLAPKAHAARSVAMATTFGAVMLDDDCVSAMRECASVPTLLGVLKRQIDCVTIVPHSHFNLGKPVAAATCAPAAASALAAAPPDSLDGALARAAAAATAGQLPPSGVVELAEVLAVVGGAPNVHPPGGHDGASALRLSPLAAVLRKGRLPRTPQRVRKAVHLMQRYSLPLMCGVMVALLWANLDPPSYEFFVGSDYHLPHWSPLGQSTYLFGHKVTLHFLVNDIFMVFFFGLAAKEVTEACLPGGSLSPLRKAFSPLIGTLGGVIGPILVFLFTSYALYATGAYDGYESKLAVAAREDALAALAGGVDSGHLIDAAHASHGAQHRMRALGDGGGGLDGRAAGGASAAPPLNLSSAEAQLGFAEIAHGWGVPTATDISLAWMVALQVFPLRHPAIEFLLLLAVADDAIGLVIIAAVYGDDAHPVRPIWLLLILAGIGAAVGLRTLPWRSRNCWSLYIVLAGVPCWIGLIQARLHPALALCFVVPFLPDTKLAEGGYASSLRHRAGTRGNTMTSALAADPPANAPPPTTTHTHDPHAALHAFEHALKLPIDVGMFFFTLANAGVPLSLGGGPLTLTVFLALLLGKLVGIYTLVLLCSRYRCAPLGARIKPPDLAMLSTTASIGLTVALFISGEAYATNPRLQGEAKLGALLSGTIGTACIAFARTPCWARRWKNVVAMSDGAATVSADSQPPTEPPMGTLHDLPRLRCEYYDHDDVADLVTATLERSFLLSRVSRPVISITE